LVRRLRWTHLGAATRIGLVALLAGAALLASGCTQKEQFSPYLEGGLGTDSLFADTTLTAAVEYSATSAQSAGDASSSRRLVVANWDGYAARTYLKFSFYPDTSLDVTSAKLFLYVTRVEGEAGTGTFGLYPLADSLVQAGLRWGNMPAVGDEIMSFGLPSQPEDSVVLDVTGIVSAWGKGTATNRGLMIKCHDEFSPTQTMVEFASTDEPFTRQLTDADSTTIKIWPVLRVVSVDSTDSTEFTQLAAAIDTFADTLTTSRSNTVLTVANGFPSRTFIKFDFSGVPREATVTRAVLQLAVDLNASSFDSMAVICHAVLDTVSGFGASYGASGSGKTVLSRAALAEDPSFAMDVTPLVQPQVSGLVKANYGFVVKSSDETTDLDFVVLVPTGSGETALAPRLEIHYVVPPRPWYWRN
jgi:hypothetical protein